MPVLKNSFVSATTYNSLPHISEASRIPTEQAEDLQNVLALLTKYHVPTNICVRLIHKHFDLNAGEAMVVQRLDIPNHGAVSILRPVEIAAAPELHGVHFFVGANGALEAYEYSPAPPPPDMSGLQPFFAAFGKLVVERGLQHKLGLKIVGDTTPDEAGWTEFEFPEDRRTIMIPSGFPTPDGEYELTVPTEFHPDLMDSNTCSHTRQCTHCSHPVKKSGELHVGGRQVLPGTPFHDFFTAVVEVW